jgi:hypothetical protein
MEISTPPTGRGFWRFDPSLLASEEFKEEIERTIEETATNNQTAEPPLLWETIKSSIRGTCVWYKSKRNKIKDKTIENLEKSIQDLECKEAMENLEEEEMNENGKKLEEQKHQLQEHVEEKGRWETARFKGIIHGMDEKPNKFFLNQGKTIGSNKCIKRLTTDSGMEITDQKEILNEEKRFYQTLYKSSLKEYEEDREARNGIWDKYSKMESPKIADNEWDLLTNKLSEEEIWKAITTSQDNKSPGTDGLTNNFYKAFWHQIKKYLLNSYNHTLENGNLSISQKQGVISLIPKANKDITKLKNWRPITLLNQDYKYLAKCLANRCRRVLPDIISPDQTGFVPNRIIGTNIIKAQQMMEEGENGNIDGLLMSIDFEKAFDTVEWQHIQRSLQFFNFPQKLINWIMSLYNNISTCTINNGHTSQFFHPTRGVRQGCPLSPILFVIAAEMLSIKIRTDITIQGLQTSKNSIKIAQFADDTIFYLKNNNSDISKVFTTLEEFSMISGLKVNKEKTEIIILGTHINKDLEKQFGQSIKENIKMLGVHLAKEKAATIELNYVPIFKKMEETMSDWRYRGLSLSGKITILKTMVISKLIYAISVLPSPPTKDIEKIQTDMLAFVWDNKPPMVRKDTLIGDYIDGGYRMPNILLQTRALKMSWIIKLSELSGNWADNIISILPLEDPEYFMHCNVKFCDIPLELRTNKFWGEIFLNWCIISQQINSEMAKTIESLRNENLWWNSDLKINGKLVQYKHWAEKGITKVHHLYSKDGNLLSHEIPHQSAIH